MRDKGTISTLQQELVINIIETKGLWWFGHVVSMTEDRCR